MLIDLRTRQDKLVGKLEPDTMRLHVLHRGESVVFDLRELAQQYVGESTGDVLVRIVNPTEIELQTHSEGDTLK